MSYRIGMTCRVWIAVMVLLVGVCGARGQERKPNILMIMGDDIGSRNPELLQPRGHGISHAQHRPHRGGGRAVHVLVRPAELHGRPHLDGHNLKPFFYGEAKGSPRKGVHVLERRGAAVAVRLLDIKMHFLIQEHKSWDVRRRNFTSRRIPLAFNRRSDPFERADESVTPFETSNQMYFIEPGRAVVAKWMESFKEFPPRQKPAKYNVDEVARLPCAAIW